MNPKALLKKLKNTEILPEWQPFYHSIFCNAGNAAADWFLSYKKGVRVAKSDLVVLLSVLTFGA